MIYLTPKEALKNITSKRDIVLEIGFGNGSFLKWLAVNRGNKTVVGIDIANLAFHKATSRLKEEKVYTVKSEALFFLKYMVQPESLEEVYILFPDPWPKNKKRRLINPTFATILASRLKKDGVVFIATDDTDYQQQIWEVMSSLMPGKSWKLPTQTKYQKKWENMGRGYKGFAFQNTQPVKADFKPALADVNLTLNQDLTEGMVLKDEESVLKVDAIFTSERGKSIMRIIYSERGFSHKYFFVQEGNRLYSLNTWGEVFSPRMIKLLQGRQA